MRKKELKYTVSRLSHQAACAVVFLLGAVSLSSCNELIKEKRVDCPAHVFIKAVPPIDTRSWENLDISMWEDGVRTENAVASVYELNRGYYIPVMKDRFFEAALLGGWPAEWFADGFLLVPEGEECPDAVGAYLGMEIGSDELYEAPLALTNLYVNVLVEIEGASSGYGIDIYATGAVDGYAYPGSGLHYGPYRAKAEELSYNERHVRIPRQMPFHDIARNIKTKADDPEDEYVFETPEAALEKLFLEVWIENQEKDEMVHYLSLPLGQIASERGYDWSTDRLEDIQINIRMADESLASVSVTIAGWTVVVYENKDDKYVI